MSGRLEALEGSWWEAEAGLSNMQAYGVPTNGSAKATPPASPHQTRLPIYTLAGLVSQRKGKLGHGNGGGWLAKYPPALPMCTQAELWEFRGPPVPWQRPTPKLGGSGHYDCLWSVEGGRERKRNHGKSGLPPSFMHGPRCQLRFARHPPATAIEGDSDRASASPHQLIAGKDGAGSEPAANRLCK